MKMLIAPWGNPSSWNEVTYRFGRKEVKSRSSLKIIQEVIQPDKTIIIGLDTLAEKGRDYQEVKQDAGKKIKKFADEYGITDYEILIAPGIGVFSNGEFYGNALDYYYYITAMLIFKLLENSENIEELHLDLTHGLNYTTVLTYRSIREILEILAIFRAVNFKAYNADPSQPKIVDRLSINIIEDSSIIPSPFSGKILQGRPLEPINLTSEERRNLFESELKNIKEIDNLALSAFIGALYNGLPLALFRFYPERNKLKKVIIHVLKIYEKYIEVNNKKKLKIIKKLKMAKDFKVYTFAYMISTLMHNLNLISSQKKEVEISKIKNLKNSLFKFDKRFKNRIEVDIYKIEKDLEDKEIRNWEIYNKIVGNNVGDPDERNFLAHSGFERNVIELKKDSNKLWIRYLENKIDIIKKLCQSGLK